MTLAVPSEMASFVQQQVRSGHFASEQEVVLAALQIMRSEANESLAGIQAGLSDAAAGRLQPVAEAFSEIRRRSQSRSAS